MQRWKEIDNFEKINISVLVPDHKRGIGHHKTSEKRNTFVTNLKHYVSSDLSGELCKIDCGYEDTRAKFYSYTKTNELEQLCDE